MKTDLNARRRGWIVCHGSAVYVGFAFARPPSCGCCKRSTRWMTEAEFALEAERVGDPICIACGDTGKNSNGNPCWPCQQNGRLWNITDPVVLVPPMDAPLVTPEMAGMGLFPKQGEGGTLYATATPRPQFEVKFNWKITMGDSAGDGSPTQQALPSDAQRGPSVPAVSPTPIPKPTDPSIGLEF